MFEINEIVSDGILSVVFTSTNAASNNCRSYSIIDKSCNVIVSGKITGNTQRTSLYIGEMKKGDYEFVLDATEQKSFSIK